MSSWTNWRKIAERNRFFPEVFDYDGPAVYEIAIGGPKGTIDKVVYVGETKNEKKRMYVYAKYGSHLARKINSHLRRGWSIYYRAQAKKSKRDAIKGQNNLLARFIYPWNTQRNLDLAERY